VKEGLQAGDKVVVEGVQKADKVGELVKPTPYTETSQEEASNPGAAPASPTPTPKG
jgi:hypothetical protein